MRDLRGGLGADGHAPRAARRDHERARARPRRHRRASLEPLAGPADHRHAALPPERRAAPLRGLAQQHVRAPPARGDRRRRPRDRRARRTAHVPAAPARAVGELAARRGREQRIALRAHRDLHPHVPALRRPRRLPHLGGVRRLRAPALRDRLDRRAHADLVERAPAPRLSDGRDPHLRRAARPRRVARARGLQLRPHRPDRASGGRRRAAPGPDPAADRGEHVARDPLRALGRPLRPRRAAKSGPHARSSSASRSGSAPWRTSSASS